ncbi:MAG: hypothetical protein BGO43_12235 [Gammaproteobacteria bacterium 39-13]|nr:protein kinase [Gammaproteobacteria bacterium]OJV92268.1 MAG: hypothetical protein BGO43_12235 [Gammaproteobacteria bacterium 39-13]
MAVLGAKNEKQFPELMTEIKRYIKKNNIKPNAFISLPIEIEGNERTISVLYIETESTEKKSEKKKEYYFYEAESFKTLGEGAQGKVILAKNVDTGTHVAVKIQRPNSTYEMKAVERERASLHKMQRLVGSLRDPDKNEYTLMQYVKGENLLHELYELDEHISDKTSMDRFIAKKIIDVDKKLRLIIAGLNQIIHLSNAQLLHRDIKTDNFISSGTCLTLIDLGSAIDNGDESKELVGTYGYIPPEINTASRGERAIYATASDIWALGVVFTEILTNENYQQQLKRKQATQFGNGVSPTYEEIITMMPDVFEVFDLSGKTAETWLNGVDVSDLNDGFIKNLLQVLVQWMIENDPTQRPTITQIEKINQKLINIHMNLQTSKYQEKNKHLMSSRWAGMRARINTASSSQSQDSETEAQSVSSSDSNDVVRHRSKSAGVSSSKVVQNQKDERLPNNAISAEAIRKLEELIQMLTAPSTLCIESATDKALAVANNAILSVLKKKAETALSAIGKAKYGKKVDSLLQYADMFSAPESSIKDEIAKIKDASEVLRPKI